MESESGACVRRFGWRRAAPWAAALSSVAALAACGAQAQTRQPPSARPARPARPAVPARPAAIAHPPVPSASASAHPRHSHSDPHPHPATHPTWLIDPDEPLPRDSRWWPVLAVARRFAVADMSYEVDEVGPAVRRTIARTCTAAFATELLSHRPTLPPGVSADQVRQQVVGVTALERLRDQAVVLAGVRSARRGPPPGAFEIRLIPRAGRWRVAAITVV